jgi:hypothetical protein
LDTDIPGEIVKKIHGLQTCQRITGSGEVQQGHPIIDEKAIFITVLPYPVLLFREKNIPAEGNNSTGRPDGSTAEK